MNHDMQLLGCYVLVDAMLLLLLRAELAVMGFATFVFVYYLLPAKLKGLLRLLWTRDTHGK